VEQGEQAGILLQRESPVAGRGLSDAVPVAGRRDRPVAVGPEEGDLRLIGRALLAVFRPQPLHFVECPSVQPVPEFWRSLGPELVAAAEGEAGQGRPVRGQWLGERRRRRGPLAGAALRREPDLAVGPVLGPPGEHLLRHIAAKRQTFRNRFTFTQW